jgi:hypothetical protein
MLVAVPVFLVSVLLCALQDWMSLVVSAALVAGMYVLWGIDYGVRRLYRHCTRPKGSELPVPPAAEGEDEVPAAEADDVEPVMMDGNAESPAGED